MVCICVSPLDVRRWRRDRSCSQPIQNNVTPAPSNIPTMQCTSHSPYQSHCASHFFHVMSVWYSALIIYKNLNPNTVTWALEEYLNVCQFDRWFKLLNNINKDGFDEDKKSWFVWWITQGYWWNEEQKSKWSLKRTKWLIFFMEHHLSPYSWVNVLTPECRLPAALSRQLSSVCKCPICVIWCE